jgi:CheY-like chemotaxis protein
LRIGFADDSSIPRDYLRGIIVRSGHEVAFSAKNGLEAVEACRASQGDIDLVILDVSMPVMMGTDAARILIAEKLVPYIIIASSNSQEGIVREMIRIGCGFVTKPYAKEQLHRAIAAAITKGPLS